MIPTPSEPGPLEPIDLARFDLTPVTFDLAAAAAAADQQLEGPDREAGILAAGIFFAGLGINGANEENGQAIAQVETDSAIIQENVNPPASELDQALESVPFVDSQMDVAEGQLEPEEGSAARGEPLAATTPPPASASPQELSALAATLLRVVTVEDD